MLKKSARKAKKAAKQSKEQLTIAVLTRARALIAKGWTRGEMATDKNGRHTESKSKAACRFCAMGAVVRAYVDLTGDDHDAYMNKTTQGALDKLRESVESISDFNDSAKSKKPVLALFDSVIARLEGTA